MAKTSSSRFLTIRTAEPNLNAGWTIRILDYKDLTSLVAVVHEFVEFSFTQQLNGAGEGSITLDQDSPFWTGILNSGQSNRALADRQYVIEAWDHDTPRFAWFAQTVSNTVVGADETRAIVLSGPGIAQALSWAVIARPGWPTPVPIIGYTPSQAFPKDRTKDHPDYRKDSPTDMLPAFSWRFPMDYPTMRMWYTVFKAAQRRGLLSFVELMFTALKDSAKQPWQLVQSKEMLYTKEGYAPPEINETLLEFLDDCTGQDYSKWFGQRLEWIMYPGFKLDVRGHIGTDRTKDVRFFQGNIISDERTRDREGIYNRVTAIDVIGGESIRTDKASIAKWNIRERFDSTQKQITQEKTRNQLADRYILQSKDEKDEWSIKIPYDDPGRVPYRNFFVGDDIGINVDNIGLTPTTENGPTKLRVMAITINVTNDSLIPECEITLSSLMDSKQRELEKQLTYILNHPQPIKLGDQKDVTVPATVKDGSSLVFHAETQTWAPGDPIVADTGSANSVFVGPRDPVTVDGVIVKTGDFWFDTDG